MDFEPSVSSEQLSAFRRDFHRHAESGFSEFWTTAFLASRLSEAGCAVLVGEEALCREARMGVPEEAVQQARLAAALEQGAAPPPAPDGSGELGLPFCGPQTSPVLRHP